MKDFFIGVDIGKNGAIVIKKNGIITSHKMPLIKDRLDIPGMADILREFSGGNGILGFELIKPFIKNKSAAFSMGIQAGVIEALCVALQIPYIKITPISWQTEMFAGVERIDNSDGKKDTKAMALMAIKRLLPGIKLTFGDKAHKPHDGLIDAALICTYLQRKHY